MSLNAGNLNRTSGQSEVEEINDNNYRVSPEVFEGRIRAKLEPVNEQISNITQ